MVTRRRPACTLQNSTTVRAMAAGAAIREGNRRRPAGPAGVFRCCYLWAPPEMDARFRGPRWYGADAATPATVNRALPSAIFPDRQPLAADQGDQIVVLRGAHGLSHGRGGRPGPRFWSGCSPFIESVASTPSISWGRWWRLGRIGCLWPDRLYNEGRLSLTASLVFLESIRVVVLESYHPMTCVDPVAHLIDAPNR